MYARSKLLFFEKYCPLSQRKVFDNLFFKQSLDMTPKELRRFRNSSAFCYLFNEHKFYETVCSMLCFNALLPMLNEKLRYVPLETGISQGDLGFVVEHEKYSRFCKQHSDTTESCLSLINEATFGFRVGNEMRKMGMVNVPFTYFITDNTGPMIKMSNISTLTSKKVNIDSCTLIIEKVDHDYMLDKFISSFSDDKSSLLQVLIQIMGTMKTLRNMFHTFHNSLSFENVVVKELDREMLVVFEKKYLIKTKFLLRFFNFGDSVIHDFDNDAHYNADTAFTEKCWNEMLKRDDACLFDKNLSISLDKIISMYTSMNGGVYSSNDHSSLSSRFCCMFDFIDFDPTEERANEYVFNVACESLGITNFISKNFTWKLSHSNFYRIAFDEWHSTREPHEKFYITFRTIEIFNTLTDKIKDDTKADLCVDAIVQHINNFNFYIRQFTF